MMVGRHSKKARGQSRRHARKPSVWSEIRGYLLTVIAVMLVVLLGRTFVFRGASFESERETGSGASLEVSAKS